MNMKFKTKQKGFSLIEVMIALVILAVGILGISKLQAVLIKNSSNANQRTVAVSIAQKKIDDLKSFALLSSGVSWVGESLAASAVAYSYIKTGASLPEGEGGAASGSSDLMAGNITIGNYTYTLSWNVSGYQSNGLSTPTSTTDVNADMKLVTITVAWQDETGDPQDISLSTVIDRYAPALTAFSDNPTSLGDDGPTVLYTPLEAPDVVPVTLDVGDQKKESSKPLPDVSKRGDSTIVQFETVTYSPIASGATATQRREEFLTAVCNCKDLALPNTTEIQFGSQEWDADNEVLQDIITTTSTVATIIKSDVDNTGPEVQHLSCTACCRDSLDVVGTTFKTCRMKRIDGIYRLVEPWRMIAFNIIPASYFSEPGLSSATPSNSLPTMTSTVQASNITLYSNYVIEKVRDALVTLQGASTVPVDTDFKNFSGVNLFVNTASTVDHTKFVSDVTGVNHRELQVRAVYLDIPPNEIYEAGVYAPIASVGVSAVPLDRIPFFENNFTQIAGWIPDISVGDSGTNTGDLSFSPDPDGDSPADYTNNHDDMDSACSQNDTPSPSGVRNYVTNESFVKDSVNQEACLNASRGDFYPIVTAASGVTATTTDWQISSRIYTSNDGVIDRRVNIGVSAVTDSIELTIQ